MNAIRFLTTALVPAVLISTAQAAPPTPADLLGRWTDDGDCSNVIEFGRDGTFTTSTGSGRWSLVGDFLTFADATTISTRAELRTRNYILITHGDGSVGESVRCSPAGEPLIPSPVLRFSGTEEYQAGGKNWVRLRYDVTNKRDFPNFMFAAAPNLAPCGTNANSSRTWVDFFRADGTRLYGFCALGDAAYLDRIWFAVERGTTPPESVYIQMHDRFTNRTYRSNAAPTR